MPDETVTNCSGCGSMRYCRRYEDMWLCLSGKSHCWRRRKVIHSKHKGKRSDEANDG